MSISNAISRFAGYYRRHGLLATIRRARLGVKRILFAGRTVVFYCDLGNGSLSQANARKELRLERLRALADLLPRHLQVMTSIWNPKLASQRIRERFEKGASLWVLEFEGQLAAYGWTLEGSTVEPYYFPLAKVDIHLFDFHVIDRYRGRGLNPYLIGCILGELAMQHEGRAYIETAEWNEAQLLSLHKTPFRRLGLVRSFRLFRQTFVSWVEKAPDLADARDGKSARQTLEDSLKRRKLI
jgi:Acetyltransferase (GNAT) family